MLKSELWFFKHSFKIKDICRKKTNVKFCWLKYNCSISVRMNNENVTYLYELLNYIWHINGVLLNIAVDILRDNCICSNNIAIYLLYKYWSVYLFILLLWLFIFYVWFIWLSGNVLTPKRRHHYRRLGVKVWFILNWVFKNVWNF